jgi:hypothetical protein
MKYLNYVALSLLSVLCFSSQAFFSTPNRAFVRAVKSGDVEVFERLYSTVSPHAYNRALKSAARRGNMDLFRKIQPRASRTGIASGLRSLHRRGIVYPSCPVITLAA